MNTNWQTISQVEKIPFRLKGRGITRYIKVTFLFTSSNKTTLKGQNNEPHPDQKSN